jgi:hypothetical protein
MNGTTRCTTTSGTFEQGRHCVVELINRDDVRLPSQGASVGNRIASGPQAGKTDRIINTSISAGFSEDDMKTTSNACVKAGGYLVHAVYALHIQ